MDTLDIQFDKYRFRHGFAALIWRLRNSKLMWKLQNSKWPWGTVYRYFWRKRLEKRIIEVSKMIAERSIYGTHDHPGFPYPEVMNKPNYDLSVPARDVPVIPLDKPCGFVPAVLSPEIPSTGIGTYAGTPPVNPSRMYAQSGIAVMDPKFIPPIYVHCDI